MTDKKMYEILENFANDHSLAKGGRIKATITENYKSFDALDDSAHYDDVCLLSEILRGAESFLFWVQRKKIKIL